MRNRKQFFKAAGGALVACLLATALALATITPLPIVTPKGPFITGQPGATSLDFVFTACDASNGNSFKITGTEILLVTNSDSMSHTFTVTSIADSLGRTNDITTYAVGAGLYSAFNFRQGQAGFRQSDATVHMTCSNAMILFAVLHTPN